MNARQLIFIFVTSILNCVSNVISDDGDYSDIERCKISDEECNFKMASLILKKYFKGIESMSLPSLDPLLITQLSVIQDLNAVKVDAKIFNVGMTGLSKAKLVKFKGFDRGEVEIRFVIPSGRMDGPYKVKGKLLKLSIEGSGQLKLSFTNMDVGLKFKIANKTIDGRSHFHAEKTKMTMSITGGTANLSHLGTIANSFIHWSFVTLVNAVKDTYCKPMSQIYMDKINALFDRIPADELFL